MNEIRFVEVRAQGNTLEGTCINYGEITKIGPTRERIHGGGFRGPFQRRYLLECPPR